jgi:hypothetical protein
MQFREIIFYENRMKHTYILCGKNSDFFNVKTASDHNVSNCYDTFAKYSVKALLE